MRFLGWSVCVVVVGLVSAAPAGGAIVRMEETDVGDRFEVETSVALVFTAGRGERNRVSVRTLKGGRYEFHDPGARVRAHAESGCRARGRHRVVCPSADEIFVELGDRDDRATLYVMGYVTGGAGNDRITGSPDGDHLRGGKGRDVVSGGRGNDRVVGNEGRDVLRGGAGSDSLDGGEPGRTRERDRLDGGSGRDRVGWAGTRLGIRASLSRGRMTGHRDRGVRIEGLVGGARNDRLVGDSGPNRLVGGNGKDILIGRGGADTLEPGQSGDAIADVRCGAGRDRVVSPRESTYVRADCERMVPAFHDEVTAAPRMRLLDRRRLAVSLICSTDEDEYVFSCDDATVELLSAPAGLPGVPRGRKPLRLAPVIDEDSASGKRTAVFKLSTRGRALVGRGGVIACISADDYGYCAWVPRLRG